jgi:hypothetical protein
MGAKETSDDLDDCEEWLNYKPDKALWLKLVDAVADTYDD